MYPRALLPRNWNNSAPAAAQTNPHKGRTHGNLGWNSLVACVILLGNLPGYPSASRSAFQAL
jgi:hypothetical protein